MKKRLAEYREIITRLEELIVKISQFEKEYSHLTEAVHPKFKKSAVNLVHYWAVRQEDITVLQNKLKKLGLSRLGRAEAHIMASIQTTLAIVKSLAEEKMAPIPRSQVSIAKGERYLRRNTKVLLGQGAKGRNVRIMVTQPLETSENSQLVDDMVEAGMNVARINCAHDDTETWLKIIENVHSASKQNGNGIKVCMDLGGPKVRTGYISSGPRIMKLRPPKDEYSRIIGPYEFHIIPDGQTKSDHLTEIPVNPAFFKRISVGSKIKLTDARGKRRKIEIVQKVDEKRYLARVYKTTVLEYKSPVTLINGKHTYSGEIGMLEPQEGVIVLNKNDKLHLYRSHIHGKEGSHDFHGQLIDPAKLSFTLPEIYSDLKTGEKVLFDDGKIEGIIHEKHDEYLVVHILNAGLRGSKLRADKGINFPDSNLNISGLTEKDKEDLRFIAEHADVVNFSFVNSREDVGDLLNELEQLHAKEKLGIILKIETQKAYTNLFEILLEAMKTYPIGVMIARGDLAIECGWTNMARIQEEILSLCNAGHVPVIWATQVLENMAKKGLPSRSEITDAATAQRAECVMLNKGPNIIEAIKLLDVILRNMKGIVDKKAAMLPAIK